jgi:tetratricopeptide (TPR) repeat protein
MKLSGAGKLFVFLSLICVVPAQTGDPYTLAEQAWRRGEYTAANDYFRSAVGLQPKNADYRVRWGRFFLERFQPVDAEKLFEEALELNAFHAGAMLGLAMVASESCDPKAVELAQRAVKLDPKLVEGYELLARMALEEGDFKKADKEADRALAVSPKALDAMATHATVLLLNDKPADQWFDRIFRIDPKYGKAYSQAGDLFILNRRYEEGIAFLDKALERDPKLWSVHSDLGVNLMRLGKEDEARKHLEIAYANEYKDAATVNTLTLMDSYKNFDTIRSGNVILKLHKKESALLRPYIETELKRAIETYDRKYKFKLERPVQLEVYPDHEDFAVRTLGMPGLGALGVTFGYVVAMDSPSGRKPGSFHWASTLWHELSHVYVLSATKHRVPRWFTEGMAVHEETATSPDWGDRLDPEAITAIKDKKLLPIAELDRGFVRPRYRSQVIVSYFQAGRICDYITEKWGYDKLLAMMHDYAKPMNTPEVVELELGVKPEEFDRQFLAWLDSKTKNTVAHFDEWRKRLKAVAAANSEKRYDDVIREGLAIRDMYPDYVEAGSVYEFLATAYLAKDDKAKAMAELEKWASIGGRSPVVLKKLAGLQQDAGKKREAAITLNRINYISPVGDEDLHRTLGELYLETNNTQGAIREYQAVLHSKPQDPASSHYNLARALNAANQKDQAKDEVLLALEAAPGYKPAQRLLLELSK